MVLITWRFLKEYMRLHLKTAMEYKANFVMQVIFMMINNAAFLVFWVVIFSNIDSINGWVLSDFMVLFALAALSYGLASFLMGNWRELNEIIAEGKLDFYLTLPKDVLAHVLVSRSSFSSVGDVFFGLLVYFLSVPFTLLNFGLLFLFVICGTLIFTSLVVMFHSATFWFGRNRGSADAFINLTLAMSSYPSILYGSVVKTIFFFIIPVFFITNASVFILQDFSWVWLLSLVFMALLLPVIAYTLFKFGVRKYESGNLVTARI